MSDISGTCSHLIWGTFCELNITFRHKVKSGSKITKVLYNSKVVYLYISLCLMFYYLCNKMYIFQVWPKHPQTFSGHCMYIILMLNIVRLLSFLSAFCFFCLIRMKEVLCWHCGKSCSKSQIAGEGRLVTRGSNNSVYPDW